MSSSIMADIDEMMYSSGAEILHPGGIEKTEEMAVACGIARDRKVLDIGSGKGITARHLAEKYGCRVIGVDLSEDMVEYANRMATAKGLTGKISFVKANALELPFEDASFDIVIAECSTVLMDKEKAFRELLRVTRPGGYVGDLEMIWQKPPGRELIEKTRQIWEGFETLTPAEWIALYHKMGMAEVKFSAFSAETGGMGMTFLKAIGVRGVLKIGSRLLLDSRLRTGALVYNKLFKELDGYIGAGYVVGRKKAISEG